MGHSPARLSTVRAALLVGLVSGPGSMARADPRPRPAALTWDAPAGCPTADDVLDAVEQALAKPSATPTLVTATARVLDGPGNVWQASLTLEVRGTRTERQFEAESCNAIAAAASLIIATVVEDASEVPSAAISSATPTSPASRSAPPSDGARPPSNTGPTTAPDRDPRFLVMANGVLDWTTTPSPPAVGLEAAVGRTWSAGSWRLRGIAGADLFPYLRPPVVPELGPVGGHFWQLGVSGRGCLATTALAAFEIGPCFGAELVAMRASSAGGSTSDFATLESATLFWFSLLGSLATSWNVSPSMDVVLHGDVVAPMKRPTFGLHNSALVEYRVPALALRGALGIELRFE
jgi:hypothetical protein